MSLEMEDITWFSNDWQGRVRGRGEGEQRGAVKDYRGKMEN